MSDLEYKIAVDAKQADAELARLHQSATTLAGSEDKLAASTTAATAALNKQGAAATKTAGFTEKLQKQASKLPDILGKQAAAISLVSSSMDGMGGQVGKVVAGAGQMAAAFGAGGPFAAALVGGMALIQGITDHFEEARLAAEALDDAKFHKMTDGIVKLSKAVQDIKAETQGLLRELDPEGAKVQDLFAVAEESLKLRADANKLSNESMAADKIIVWADRQRMRQEADLMLTKADALDAKIEVMNKLIERDNKPKSGSGTARAQPATTEEDAVNRFLDAESDQAEREQKRVAANKAMLDDIHKDDTDARALKKAADDADEAAAKERAERIADNNAAFARQNREQAKTASDELLEIEMEYANAAIGLFASSTTQLMADLIGGQEKAFEKMGAHILAQSGTFVVGKGIEAAADGAQRLLRGDPTGAAPLAGGLALVGLGAAMGGSGAAWATQLGGGGASGDRGPSSRGVPSGPATAGNGSTSNNVTIVYAGASGPTADHGARAVTDANERARDRLLRRPEVR